MTEELIAKAKNRIGYDRHLQLTGKKNADTMLFHVLEGVEMMQDFARIKVKEQREADVERVQEVRAHYPFAMFPENSKSQDALSAKMARTTCDNIQLEINKSPLVI